MTRCRAAPAAGALHKDIAERFVLLPDIASVFGVRAAAAAELSAERSTIGSALFVAHQLKRLQRDRYTGFEITRMLARTPGGRRREREMDDEIVFRCTRLAGHSTCRRRVSPKPISGI